MNGIFRIDDPRGHTYKLWWNADADNTAKRGRWWFHWLGKNCFGIEWVTTPRRGPSLWVRLADPAIGVDALLFAFTIPLILSLFLTLERFPLLERLPGVRWVSGDHKSGDRELRIDWSHGGLWINIWTQTGSWSRGDWKWHINPADIVLGRQDHIVVELASVPGELEFPEGKYPYKAKIIREWWKRPRLCWKHRVQNSVDIDFVIPIPHPGKGENSWDCGDDALWGGMYRNTTLSDALDKIYADIMRRRGPATYPPPLEQAD